MRITLNFEIASRPKKNGAHQIYLRVTENSLHFKQILDVYVFDKRNFNAQAKNGNWINTKEPLAKLFNSKLSTTLLSAQKAIMELERREELSAKNIIKSLKGDNIESFIMFIDKRCQACIDNRQYGTSLQISNLKKKLLEYNISNDVSFRDLTFSFIADFKNHLSRPKKNGRYYCQTSINSILSTFRTLYNQAVIENYIIATHSNPFNKVKIKKEQSYKTGLTKEEVEKIEQLNIEKGSYLWHTRNYFLFSIYTAGMRARDVMNLRWGNIVENRIVYIMCKTQFSTSIPIYPRTQHILNQYKTYMPKSSDHIFPILTRYERMNRKCKTTELQKYNQPKSRLVCINSQLKEIARLANIKRNISFHTARHTFACIALQSEGNVYHISKLLGHSNIAITQTYLNSINSKPQDDLLKSIFY